MTYDQFRHCIDPKAAGAVRASLGLVSTFGDAWRLVRFLATFRDA
jgi:selenocysteine lyase/cysteine desulfurase